MTIFRYTAFLTVAMMLGACGGGGGTSSLVGDVSLDSILDDAVDDGVDSLVDSGKDAIVDRLTDEDTTTTSSGTRSADFASNPGHLLSGVGSAYDRGFTGKDVVVAVVDDGIDSTHSEFAGRMLAGFNSFTNIRSGDPIVNSDCDGFEGCDTGRHGTFVAGVIAAASDDVGAHGVAPGAKLFGINVDTGEDDGFLSGIEIANPRGFAAAMAAGARIFNHSYAISYDEELRHEFENGSSGVDDRLREVIAAGGIHVYAVGNHAMDQPSMEALWPLWQPDLAGGVLAVTGIVEDEFTGDIRLASYANKCGDAQEWCLSAPTGDFGYKERFLAIVAADADGNYNSFSDPDGDGYENSTGGTSAAAAYVSGALALLKEAFPELSGKELGAILLATASDMGAAGTDAIYGRGALDIDEAIKPQGTPTVASGATLAAGLSPLSQTSLSIGTALAGASPLKGKTMVFFDAYGRAYPIDAATLVAQSAPYRESLSRLADTLGALDERQTEFGAQGKALSFGISAPALNAYATGAADANRLLKLVMRDEDGKASYADTAHFEGGFMALASDASASVMHYALSPRSTMSVTMGSSRPDADGTLDQGGELATLDYAYSVDDALAFGLRAGLLQERGGLLGSRGEGALSLSDKSMTRFVEGRFVRRMAKDIALIGEVGVGQTDSAASSGYLNFEGPLTSLETRLGLAMTNIGRKGDQLTVSGGVPLHVVDGTATTRLPTGRDAEGNIAYTSSETSLGGDIPLEMRLDYAVPLTDRLTVGLNSAVRRDASEDMYGDLALGLRLKF